MIGLIEKLEATSRALLDADPSAPAEFARLLADREAVVQDVAAYVAGHTAAVDPAVSELMPRLEAALQLGTEAVRQLALLQHATRQDLARLAQSNRHLRSLPCEAETSACFDLSA